MQLYNFSPGPSIVPQSALDEAIEGLKNFQNAGLSVAEMSHRNPLIMNMIEEAEALTREILGLTDDYHVLWMTGGASSQMFMAPMNFLNPDQVADYIDTGYWGQKAINSAKPFADIRVIASAADTNYNRIPTDWSISEGSQYLYVTSNNTIDGTQQHVFPDVNVPLICDMASDFMSRPIPIEKFGLIFAGTQKNVGIAGVTNVIIRQDMLERTVDRHVPNMLSYKLFAKEKSLYQTPPVFAIYVSMLTMRWIKSNGGLVEIEKTNIKKAAILYDEIDRNTLFKPNVLAADRSLMNVCFRAHNDAHTAEFLQFAQENGVLNIAGFPHIGGFRASLYNAMPIAGVQLLADLMAQFESKILA